MELRSTENLTRVALAFSLLVNVWVFTINEGWWRVPQAICIVVTVVAWWFFERRMRYWRGLDEARAREWEARLALMSPEERAREEVLRDYLRSLSFEETIQVSEWMACPRDRDDAPPVVRTYLELAEGTDA